jgi:hypothetical protein
MFQVNTTDQIVPIHHLQYGQFFNIIVTGTASDCVLEFQNGDSGVWSEDPSFTGTHTGGVINERVKCISGLMRLNFATAPGSVWITTVWDSRPS